MARTVMIIYEHFTPSVAHIGRLAWSGIFKDTLEAFDYDTKHGLITSCKKYGYNYEVVRQKKNGERVVVQRG